MLFVLFINLKGSLCIFRSLVLIGHIIFVQISSVSSLCVDRNT
jgi:hypothetical protein